MSDDDRSADGDRLVKDYLSQLRRAARSLPRARRQELLAEIEAHIAEARAARTVKGGQGAGQQAAPAPEGNAGTTQTSRETAGDVRAVLDRLGDPADIVSEAGGAQLASRPGGLEITAVILLLVGGFLAGIGWVVGVVLLWVSPRWRWPDKLLGTLVWPGGLSLFFILGALSWSDGACTSAPGAPATCASTGPPSWVAISVLVLLIAAPIAVAAWLLRRARRLPAQAVPGASEMLAR
jgi:HAAS